MWPRILEFCIGLWLALSPFIFGHIQTAAFLTINDFLCALFIIIFSLASYSYKFYRIHLLNALVGIYLIAITFLLAPVPSPAGFQNYVVIGLLLIMIAILPNRSNHIPQSWQRFYEQRSKINNKE